MPALIACMAPRQPMFEIRNCARTGAMAPPIPAPTYASAMARPRQRSNQREMSTWLGIGPAVT